MKMFFELAFLFSVQDDPAQPLLNEMGQSLEVNGTPVRQKLVVFCSLQTYNKYKSRFMALCYILNSISFNIFDTCDFYQLVSQTEITRNLKCSFMCRNIKCSSRTSFKILGLPKILWKFLA
jgi:hypothetical protein